MMTGYIVEYNPVIVEIVQNGDTVFVAFTVIGLRLLASSSPGPSTGVRTTTVGPVNDGVTASFTASGPEIWERAHLLDGCVDLLGVIQRG